MLEEVRITGLGVINDALLELSPGFTALTGETGAGKTMVVTGLGLLFGGRADPARVRPGTQRASVEGRLRTDPRGKVAQQVEDAVSQVRIGADRIEPAAVERAAEVLLELEAGQRLDAVTVLTLWSVVLYFLAWVRHIGTTEAM